MRLCAHLQLHVFREQVSGNQKVAIVIDVHTAVSTPISVVKVPKEGVCLLLVMFGKVRGRGSTAQRIRNGGRSSALHVSFVGGLFVEGKMRRKHRFLGDVQ